MNCTACNRIRAGPGSSRAASSSTVRTASSIWSLCSSAWESRTTASTRASPSRPDMPSAVRRWPMVRAGAVRKVAQPSS
ncbi:hypothetical protein SHIRM173S_12365 [Streptomyces hirsutus]